MRTLLQKLNIDDNYVINKLTEVAIHCSYMNHGINPKKKSEGGANFFLP